MENRDFQEIVQVCEPIVNYLKQNHAPHTRIIVSSESIKVVQDIIGIPADSSDY